MRSGHKVRRLGAIAWPVAVGALVLAACGSDVPGSATASTIDLKPTEFLTKEPTPTTLPPPVTVSNTLPEQQYVIQVGDNPTKVANQFGVPMQELLNYNGIALGTFPFPGETILIPPGGTNPAAVSESDATTGGDTATAATDDCEPDAYVLIAGDNPSKVANAFDVTLDALRAANANNPAFTSFIVGTEIVIPADC